jgi:hypothetical protein
MLQRNILHFLNNLEILIQSFAIRKHCDDFDKHFDEFVCGTCDMKIDMDVLVEMHNSSMIKILDSCFITQRDRKTKIMKQALEKILLMTIEFRRMCKKYLSTGDEEVDEHAAFFQTGIDYT